MQTITCLIFDLGGVLVRNDMLERLMAMLPEPVEEEALKSRLLASPALRDFERGRSEPEAFAHAFVEEMRLRCSPAAFIEAFRYWPQGLYPGAAEWLKSLRGRYRLACLSNSNALHWDRFNGFVEHFDVPMSSHLLGEIKPDAACFGKALSACSVDAAEVLFLDDALVNVEAAGKLGIRALHVVGFEAAQRAVDQL